MKIITAIDDAQMAPSVATIGFFDGVHRGHRFLLSQVDRVARARGLATTVVTFPVHPRKVMQADYLPQMLSTIEEKVARLEQAGVDNCVLLSFTRELATLSARDFMERVLVRLGVKALVIGYDNRFGHNRSEGFDDYVRYGREIGIDVIRATPYEDSAVRVSSSVVRTLLADGQVDFAARCLGYRYSLTGVVVDGRQEGRKMGFPTANISVDAEKMLPASGVYAAVVRVDESFYSAMLNIGVRPTMNNGNDKTIEVHMLDFEGDVYGRWLTLEFVCRLRDEKKFASKAELEKQLRKDEQSVRRIMSEHDEK